MNQYSILPLASSLIGNILGILVFVKNFRKNTNVLFSILCIFISIWYFSLAVMLSTADNDIFNLFTKIGLTAVNFIAIPYLLFSTSSLGIKNRKLFFIVLSIFVISLFDFLILWNNKLTFRYYLSGVHLYNWGTYPKAGIGEVINAFITCITIVACTTYYSLKIKKIKKLISSSEFMRAKYIFIAMVIFGLCAVDYLPKFGINIYPFGCIFFLLFASTITYAILRHNLLDIKIVIQKGLIYSLLVGFITAIFVVMILLLEKFFQGFAGYRSLLASGVTAFVIAISFNPMKNKVQAFVDRYFFRGTTEEIAQENIKLHQELLKHDRMKAAATLSASSVHEIKNPLATIKTFIDFLPERHADKNFIDNFMRLVAPQIEKINFTVQQLLDFSKPAIPNLRQVKIYKVLDETLELLSNDFIKHKIKSQTQFSDDNAMVSADPNQLKQVFLNLFLNSIDAMPQGGNLFVSGKTYNDSVEVYIQDTGHGISKENLKRIFQPFFTTKSTGTGLGLSVVRDILEQHKATIRAESEIGKGTKFIIKFPTIESVENKRA